MTDRKRRRRAVPEESAGQPGFIASYGVVLVAVTALAASIAGIGNGLVHDDVPILGDARMSDFAQWWRFFAEPFWPPPYAPDQYRPLTSLALALENFIGGGAPSLVRAASYLLYVAASLLVFRMARALMGDNRPAFVAALVFAAHPIHVEAVALGVGQAELLVAIFATWSASIYVEARRDARFPDRNVWIRIVALCGAAMLSKEQGFVAPALLIATELAYAENLRERLERLWKGYLAIGLLSLVVLSVRGAVLDEPMGVRNVAEALSNAPLSVRLLTVLQLVPHWLRLTIWPVHLRADYSPQEFNASQSLGPVEVLGLALLLVLAAGAWHARGRQPVVAVGVVWFLIALAPVSNILPTGVLIAERTLMLPSIGLVVAAGGGIALVMDRAHTRSMRVAMNGAFLVLLAAAIVRSGVRHTEWRSDDSLTVAAMRDSPRSWRANANYGDRAFREGRLAEAMAAYEEALRLAPEPWWIRNSYAARLREAGRHDAALEQWGRSLTAFPNQPQVTLDMLGQLLFLGRYSEVLRATTALLGSGRGTAEIARLHDLAADAEVRGAPPGSVRFQPLQR